MNDPKNYQKMWSCVYDQRSNVTINVPPVLYLWLHIVLKGSLSLSMFDLKKKSASIRPTAVIFGQSMDYIWPTPQWNNILIPKMATWFNWLQLYRLVVRNAMVQ